jgi:hypothetical protein
MFPEGISRWAVRGFFLSQAASTMRLNPIAADLAQTSAIIIQNTRRGVTGFTLFANIRDTRAKGKANMVCSNLIMRP